MLACLSPPPYAPSPTQSTVVGHRTNFSASVCHGLCYVRCSTIYFLPQRSFYSTPSRDTPHPLWTTLVWCAFLLMGAATAVFRCVSADSTLAIIAPRIYDITDTLLPLLEQHSHVPTLRQILILGTFCFSILICVLVRFFEH